MLTGIPLNPMGLVIHVMGLFAGFLAGLFGFADDCVSGVLSGNLGCSSLLLTVIL